MFTPKYRISIMNKYFREDEFICLGTQLISIVNSIVFLPQHIWYGADVEAIGKGVRKHNLSSTQLNLIGSDSQFIEYCYEIEQFIWGVFLCIDSKFSSQNIQGVELETEDKPFRSISCEGVILEIRTFDTTCFEVYSEDIELMKKISKTYEAEIDLVAQ